MKELFKEFILNYSLNNPQIGVIKIDEMTDLYKNSFILNEYLKAVIKDNYKIENNSIILTLIEPENEPRNAKDITQKDILKYINQVIEDTNDEVINIIKLYNSFKKYYEIKKYKKQYFIDTVKDNFKMDVCCKNIVVLYHINNNVNDGEIDKVNNNFIINNGYVDLMD